MVNFEVHFSTQISTFIYQSIPRGSSQDKESLLQPHTRSLKQSDLQLAAVRGLAISFRKRRAPGKKGLTAENVASLLCQDSKCLDTRCFSGRTQQTRDSNVKALFSGHWFGTFSCPSSPQFIFKIYCVVSFKVFLSFALFFPHLSPSFTFVKYEAFFSLHN